MSCKRIFVFLFGLWRLLLCGAVVSSCSSAPPPRPAGPLLAANAASGARKDRPRPVFDEKHLHPGYLLRFTHPEDAKLDRAFRVGFDGELRLPYGVKLNAAGATLAELQARVDAAYRKYFRNETLLPRVRVESRAVWIEVRGLVVKPGRYLLRPDASLDEAIAHAGGLQTNSGAAYAKLQQGDSVAAIELSRYYNEGEGDLLPAWRGGDILFLQRESARASSGGPQAVTVLGEVHKPGEFAYREHADLLYYLTRAGGPTQYADLKSVRILRGDGDERRTEDVDLTEPRPVTVDAGDFVMVSNDSVGPMEKHMPLIGALASVISALAVILVAI